MSKCHDVHAESIEIDLFRCKKEAYVYQIPSATTSGHRAELWRLDEWLAEVSVRVVRRGDDTGRDEAVIRLETTATGELFAEAPVKLPLRTSIEPVIDSSRYFVLRVVDANSGAHAFIGLGFRDREHASDFMAALDDHAKYVQRQIQAEEMKHQAQSNADGHEATGDAVNPQTLSSTDLAFKPGERVVLPLHAETTGDGGFVTGNRAKLAKTFSLMFGKDGDAVAALAPPPKVQIDSGSGRLSPIMGVSPKQADAEDVVAGWGDFTSAT